MTDRVTFVGPYETRERSAATFTVTTREGDALFEPTNLYYRLDDAGTGIMLADWTPAELAGHVADIAITPEQNRIVRESQELERKTLSVMVDRGLDTQFVASYTYAVRNLGWTS